ncbi:GntR family transcriptional regulator [Pseudorhodobacter sp.]|uniref:GntR family transcriptional regulator n=1 Tax=Pseudorhodobacter sp. TaxID=1934400 RepID=UPI002647F0B6|nr:GntR family transcriptional regulator [Pseudorhodobacter sp.]MDN5788796.1 GntR family transcriptional regulator [Pseudorhodobacter sp.]
MTVSKHRVHQAYQRIISAIFEGTLKSGDLLQEAVLGDAFGMSRTPVREAIKRLESEGLVAAEGRFMRVRSMTVNDVDETFFLRRELEPFAARSAIRLPTAQLDAMEERVRQLMVSDPEKNDLQRQTDYDFHRMLVREMGNPVVAATISALHRRTCVFDHTQVPKRLLLGCKEHLEIIAAARSGSADAVETALRDHLDRARDAVLERLGKTQAHSHTTAG